IKDRVANAKVRGKQLAMNKLGALFLFTSQGITFMHEGQEWGRSKVIAPTAAPDPRVGQLDHNSYEKDNETNWLNWDEKDLNRELVDYYRGLIRLRKAFPEFRNSDPEDFTFLKVGNKVAVAYILQNKFAVLLNGDIRAPLKIKLPKGTWRILVDGKTVNLESNRTVADNIVVPPTSGMVLRKES
ncbi:MAG: pullulanase, partial [FCB group bacterium]|nr:pullulanase [FCB group bacterium]